MRNEATRTLTQQALRLFGTHYRLVGAVRVQVLRTTLLDNRGEIATLSVRVGGTWMYQFGRKELEMIKMSSAGKTLRQVRLILSRLPGIRRVGVEGLGENTRLPKSTIDFRMLVLIGEIPLERDG